MKADAILMHRTKNIIAVRAQQSETSTIVQVCCKTWLTLKQVYDLDSKQKLKQAEIPEVVTFWKYVSLTKIALIGKTAAFHIDITNQNAPEKVFERAQQLANCQVMSYGVDSSEKWCFLVGLYSPDQKNINAWMQLYNTEKKQMQILEGFAGCFADVQVNDVAGYKSSIFSFCEKKAAEPNVQKIHFMEIGNPAPGQNKHRCSVDIQMPPDV